MDHSSGEKYVPRMPVFDCQNFVLTKKLFWVHATHAYILFISSYVNELPVYFESFDLFKLQIDFYSINNE